MPECQACGKTENLEMGETTTGKPMLLEIRRVPHFAVCPKNGAKPKKAKPGHAKTVARDAVAESAKLLRDMNYTKAEAADMLKDIPEAAPEDMVLAAITKMGEG